MVPMTQAAPLMSNFISSMVGGSLSEMPPVSNVMPLPTSTDGRAFGTRVAMFDDQEPWRLFAALGDGEEAAHLFALDLGQAEHLHAQGFVVLARSCAVFGEVRGRADVAGQVGEVAHERGAGGERAALGKARG